MIDEESFLIGKPIEKECSFDENGGDKHNEHEKHLDFLSVSAFI